MKKTSRKLSVSREVVRQLTRSETEVPRGGVIRACTTAGRNSTCWPDPTGLESAQTQGNCAA